MRSGAAGVVLGCSRKRHSFADGVDLEDSCRDPPADVCPAPAVASARGCPVPIRYPRTCSRSVRCVARPPAKPELPYKNGRRSPRGDSRRHSPASVSDRSVLTLRLSRRLVLPVWTETCTKIRTNAAADAGGHPRLSKTPRSGLNRDRTHRGQKMAPLQRKSMASLSARSKE